MYLTEHKCLELINQQANNPFLPNDLHTLIELIKYGKINDQFLYSSNIYKSYNISCIYFKYMNKFSPDFFKYLCYSILYNMESQLFEQHIKNVFHDDEKILDVGCGACEFWTRNQSILSNLKKVDCIDLNNKILKYPQFLLKDISNINILNKNIYDLDMNNYDLITFIEVIMQIPEPHKMIQYIWDNNPNCTILFAHNVFPNLMSKIFTPFRIHLFPHIPLLDIAYGKLLTLEDTQNMVNKAGGKIIQTIKVSDYRHIFIATSLKNTFTDSDTD
jgi:2-polyprenyl-3-methyl-5-hydroxy-6-metoxy-1,4-benzoquinol methylase